MGSGYAKMKKQRKQFEEQFAKMQENMQSSEYKGSAGNGLVEVILSGDKSLKSIVIQPECVDKEDVEGLQDLILAAFQDAGRELEAQTSGGVPNPMSLFS